MEISKLRCFVPANSADTNKIQHYATFHLGLHCLQRFSFRRFIYTEGKAPTNTWWLEAIVRSKTVYKRMLLIQCLLLLQFFPTVVISTLSSYAIILPRESWLLYIELMMTEPQHEISTNVVCATSNGSDQPEHTHSLIGAFASSLNIL